MTRTTRMKPIKEVDDSRGQDTSSGVAPAEQVLREREQQLEQLKRYREEYASDNGQSVGAVGGKRLENYRAFVERLNDAIHELELVVQAARDDYQRKHDIWTERRIEGNALETTIQDMRLQEGSVQDGREPGKPEEQAASHKDESELSEEGRQWKLGITGKWKINN